MSRKELWCEGWVGIGGMKYLSRTATAETSTSDISSYCIQQFTCSSWLHVTTVAFSHHRWGSSLNCVQTLRWLGLNMRLSSWKHARCGSPHAPAEPGGTGKAIAQLVEICIMHILPEWFCTCAVVALGGAHLKSCLPDAQGTRLGGGLWKLDTEQNRFEHYFIAKRGVLLTCSSWSWSGVTWFTVTHGGPEQCLYRRLMQWALLTSLSHTL